MRGPRPPEGLLISEVCDSVFLARAGAQVTVTVTRRKSSGCWSGVRFDAEVLIDELGIDRIHPAAREVSADAGHAAADGVGHMLNFPLVVLGGEVEVDLGREHDGPRLMAPRALLEVAGEDR